MAHHIHDLTPSVGLRSRLTALCYQNQLVFSEAFRVYEDDLMARGLSHQTIQSYRFAVKRLILELGDLPLKDATSFDLRRFVTILIENQSPQTVRTYFQNLRTFFEFCVGEELIESNPMRRMRTPRTETKLLDALTTDHVIEIDRLLARLAKGQLIWLRNHAIFSLFVETGVRRSECAGLRLDSWNPNERRLTIEAETSKSRRSRYVFLGTRCADLFPVE